MTKLITGLLVLFLLLISVACAQPTQVPEAEPEPTPTPTPTPELTPIPLPVPESELPFEAGISVKERNLPGEDVLYGIGITNLSSGTITIDPFPPAMWIKPVGQDETVYSSAAGNRTRDIESDYPSSWYHSKGFWDQKDNNGEQVAPGWYEIGYEYVIIEQNTGKRYTVNPTAKFQIVYPDSAMNKDLDVNQSVTAEGITVTLERIELNAVEVTVYTFTTPPGYSLPEEHPPTRIWKTGQLQEEELDSLLEFIKNSGFEELEDGYKFPGKPIAGGGFSMGDMNYAVSINYGDLHKTVWALGYLTPDQDLTYPDMPYPLNDMYQRLKQIAEKQTQVVASETIKSSLLWE